MTLGQCRDLRLADKPLIKQLTSSPHPKSPTLALAGHTISLAFDPLTMQLGILLTSGLPSTNTYHVSGPDPSGGKIAQGPIALKM